MCNYQARRGVSGIGIAFGGGEGFHLTQGPYVYLVIILRVGFRTNNFCSPKQNKAL